MKRLLAGAVLILAGPALAAEACGTGPSGVVICNVLDENGRIVRTYKPERQVVKDMALGTVETKRLTLEEEAQSLKLLAESLQSEAEDAKRRAASLADENARLTAQNASLSEENTRLSAELERVKPQPGLCSNTTRLSPGMTKKQVAKLFGEPSYSRMEICGGAPGVRRWQCETVTYLCNGPSGGTSTVSLTFGGNSLNNWQ